MGGELFNGNGVEHGRGGFCEEAEWPRRPGTIERDEEVTVKPRQGSS